MTMIQQFIAALGFLATLYLAGLIFLPATMRLFSALPDRGYCIARLTGLTALALLAWLLNAFGLLLLSTTGLWVLFCLAACVSLLLQRYLPTRIPSLRGHLSLRYILLSEAVFLAAFFGWLYVRACGPDIAHTEQPMDFTMLAALCSSPAWPSQDLWLAGYPVCYYYFGYWLQAVPSLLAGIPLAIAYNIAQAAWFALLVSGCFGLGANLASTFFKRRIALIGGGLLCTLMLLISNTAGLLSVFRGTAKHWWWWPASRAVSDGTTELITEFPAFSFILGDNHPHLLALPLLLLLVTYCAALLFRLRGTRPAMTANQLAAAMLVCAILQCVIFMTNSWDWPIAFGIGLLTFVLSCRAAKPRLQRAAAFTAISITCLLIIPLPYHLTAQSQFNGFRFFHGLHTGAAEWLLVFGLLLPGLLTALAWLIWRTLRLRDFSAPVLLLIILLIAGLTAALIPEFVFLRDVFNNRMNTVFKFYWQAIFYLSLAASIGLIAASSVRGLRIITGLIILAVIPAGLLYPARALYDITNRFTPSPYGLDGLAWLNADQPELAAASEWITQNTPADAVLLTAPGASYNPATIPFSLLTQRPVLLGWTGHEQQWRGHAYPRMASNRTEFIRRAYRDGPARALTENPLWQKIDLFVVGPQERRYAEGRTVFLTTLSDYLQPVFSNATVTLYEKK
jgi:uncharacterized membrane protein